MDNVCNRHLFSFPCNIVYVDVNSLKLRSVFPLCRIKVKFYVLHIKKKNSNQHDIMKSLLNFFVLLFGVNTSKGKKVSLYILQY